MLYNNLPFHIKLYIDEYLPFKNENKEKYDKVLTNVKRKRKRLFCEFRAFFVNEFLKNEYQIEKFVLHFLIYDNKINKWRQAYVYSLFFNEYLDDGAPSHSIVFVPKFKQYEEYSLVYLCDNYWRPLSVN